MKIIKAHEFDTNPSVKVDCKIELDKEVYNQPHAHTNKEDPHMTTDLEDDLYKLIEDYPHPKLIMGEYEIIVEGVDDYDEHYELYKDSEFIQSFEIPQNIIDFLGEEGIDLESVDYEIE